MDNTSLRDFNKGEGTYVADALERSLLLLVNMEDLKKSEEAGALPQHEEVPGHGKTFGTRSFSGLSFLVPYLYLDFF